MSIRAAEAAEAVDGPGAGAAVAGRRAGLPVIGADGRPRARRTRRDWVVDVVLTVLVLFTSGLLLVLSATPVPDDEPELWRATGTADVVLNLALGLPLVVAMWWRRRWPVTLGIVSGLAAAFSDTAGVVALVLLLTVAIHRRWPWALLVGAVNLVAGVAYVWWWQTDEPSWVLWTVVLAFGVLVTAAVLAFGMFIRARRLLLASLRERAERAEAEQRRSVVAARQGERTRIAREMHDVLAHRISLVSMHAGALEYSRDASPEEVATAAGVIRGNAHQALVDLREVIGVLRGDGDTGERAAGSTDGTATSRPQPTLDALDALLEESRAAGMRVTVEVALDPAPLPATTGRTAYRVLQEGLTNARKHGRGGAVDVCVRGVPGEGLDLDVVNKLRPGATGADATSAVPGSGVGLVGVAERTRLAGGRAEHGVVGDAFRLHVWLPWPEEAP